MARAVYVDFDFQGTSSATGLRSPVGSTDAATKGYVDSLVEGLAWKDSVRVSSTGNVSLASPGATIDGITMATNDRVLLKDQTTQSQNGIYVWNGAAVPMTRAADASTSAELEQAVTSVEEGTNAGASFRQSQVNFTIDSGSVVWTSFSTAAAAASETIAGVIEIATQTETDTGTDDVRAITPLKLANWSGRKRKFAADFGDGSALSYTITHSFGTRDVQVAVYRNSGNYDEVLTDVEHTTTNAVTIKFGTGNAPASNALRCVVIG